jgi:hypothetical protein
VARAAERAGRGAAMNTFGLGADAAQLLGPWGLGLAAGTWGFGGALAAAAASYVSLSLPAWRPAARMPSTSP